MSEIDFNDLIKQSEFVQPELIEEQPTGDIVPQKPEFNDLMNDFKIKPLTPMGLNYEIPEFKQPAQDKGGYLKQTVQGGIREIRDFGSMLGTGLQIALGAMVLTPDDKRKIAVKVDEGVKTTLKNNPTLPIDIVKSAVIDTMASFGQTPDDLTINPKVFMPRIKEKFKDKPIETALDLSIILGLGKKVMTKSYKKINDLFDKKMLKEVLDNNGTRLKTINDDLKAVVKTNKDDLLDNVELIKKMNIKQLDEPRFVLDKGQKLADDILNLERAEGRSATNAIMKIADQPVNTDTLRRELLVKLRNKGLVDETGGVLKELNKSLLDTELKALRTEKGMNVGFLKKRLDNVDDKINWVTSKEVDDGLKEVRSLYRDYLGRLSPEYDTIQKRRHEFLNRFGNKIKQLKQSGGGERFAKRFFSTDEEIREFSNLLKNNPQSISGAASARFDQIKAWHSWNNYFRQNERYVPNFLWINRGLPLPVGKLITPIQKRTVKTAMKIPGGKQATLRTGLELKDMFQNTDNKE